MAAKKTEKKDFNVKEASQLNSAFDKTQQLKSDKNCDDNGGHELDSSNPEFTFQLGDDKNVGLSFNSQGGITIIQGEVSRLV